jgi:uncharacterized protein (TIGR00251 family)
MPIATDDTTSAIPATLIAVKAVPGAKRDEVVGRLGERLKVRISAPPEDGKANKAICQLLAQQLGVKSKDVEVVRGHTSAEKTLRVIGVQAIDIETKWPQ